jgi:PEP-CTERM motif
MLKNVLALTALSLAAVGANAAVTAGLANQNPSSFIALSAANVQGGALYTGSSIPNVAAIPTNTAPAKATVGTWLAAGPSNTNNGGGDAKVSFGSAGTSFVSFLWGSPDTYNMLTVTEVGGATTSFTSANLPLFVFNGNQNFASYVGFTAVGSASISSLTFSSTTSNAFEASNFSVTTPVPEPETYALMLAGLAAVGFIARRRQQA